MGRNKLYVILSLACLAGYVWLLVNLQQRSGDGDSQPGVCFFRHVTSIPCPSCGSTRSVSAILHGDLSSAFHWNPLGFLLAALMVIVPVWLIRDLLTNGQSLLTFYLKAEDFVRQRRIAIIAVLLIIVNWIWNIYKFK